jgi:AraC-like DNA-binding protein/quercetin dioxygenase-like cupin family protein
LESRRLPRIRLQRIFRTAMRAEDFTIRRIDNPDPTELHVGREVGQYDTDWHFHNEWQVTHVTAGTRLFEWRGGGVTVGQGQTLIFPPAFVHRGRSSDQTASFIMLYASPESTGMLSANSPTLSHEQTLADVLSRAGLERSCTNLKSMIWSNLLTPSQATTYCRASMPASVSRAKAWLESHQGRLHRFNELGDIGGCSPFHMSRLFRQWTGVSPRAFRLQLRLLEARRRISEGQAVALVAAELGFADQSHLGRQFKRAFGLQPGRYSRLFQSPTNYD